MFFSKSKKLNFEKLVIPHLDKLYRFAYRLCGQRDDAEDLVQDLVLKLQPKYEDLLKIEKLDVWMCRVMYNMFVDNKRRYQRSPVRVLSDLGIEFHQDDFLDSFTANEYDPEHYASQDHFKKRLNLALNCLSEDYRLALVMFELEGRSLDEICQILQVPSGTLKSRLHRARIKLRQLLEEDEEQTSGRKRTNKEALL